MTAHCNTVQDQHQLPHVPFAHVLKKACLQQEQAILNLQSQLQIEQMNAVVLRKEMNQIASTDGKSCTKQRTNTEVDNLKKECEEKDVEMKNLKAQLEEVLMVKM